MTLPSSWKDQLAAFGFEVPCDDVRLGGTLTALHTSSSECAITVQPESGSGYICGSPLFDPTKIYVVFLVTYRNTIACPPFTSPDTIVDQLTCSHSIYRTEETSTYVDLLTGVRKFKVWVVAGTIYPVCDSVSLTAENTCSDIGYGVWKPSCLFRDCANCDQAAYNVPDLNFSKDITWTNPVSYSTWLATPLGSKIWVQKYRMKQTFSAPTNIVAIAKRKPDPNCLGNSPNIDYETDFTMLEQWNGKDWVTGVPIDVDWEWTVSGKAYIRFSTNLGRIWIVLNKIYAHSYRQWTYRSPADGGGYGLIAKSWTGCFQSVNPPNYSGDCGGSGIPNVNQFTICTAKPVDINAYACGLDDTPQEVAYDLMWAGVSWNGTSYVGVPQFPVPGKILPYSVLAYAPGLNVSLSSISTPCGTLKQKYVSC